MPPAAALFLFIRTVHGRHEAIGAVADEVGPAAFLKRFDDLFMIFRSVELQ